MSTSISTYLGYRLYANNIAQSLQTTAAAPVNATAAAYYNANIGKVASVDQFVGNYKLFSYAMAAYGLSDMNYASAFMKKVLESDLSDSHSFANSLSDPRYLAFAKAFQFGTDGTLSSVAQLQTSTQKSDIETRFAANSTGDASDQASATSYYEQNIGSVTSVADLEKDPTLYKYVLTAYGIDPNTPQTTVTHALESNPTDPNSFANTSGDVGLAALATDFNFAADGTVSSPRLLQSATTMKATVSAYSSAVGFDTTAAAASSDTAAQSAAKAETAYYQATIPTLTSLDQFLGDSRLTAYAIKAYGLPADTTAAQLRTALTSDPTDPKSAASTMGQGFDALAAAFNVGTDGSISQVPDVAAQSKAQIAATDSAYLYETMETQAGTDQGTGVQLALYFRQHAASLTDAYQILADPALTKVVQTALGLSATSSNADIDAQAKAMTAQLNFSSFQDPQKLDQFIDRFSVLYDLQNGTTGTDPVLQLFQSQ